MTNTTKQEERTSDLRKTLVDASKYFHSKGWMQGTSGNLSLKVKENQFLITASGKDKGSLTEEDFISIEKKGDEYGFSSKTPNPKAQPSAETLLHACIYENTNANVIYHVHTTNSTLLSMQENQSEVLTFSGLEMLKGLGFKTHEITITIPTIPNSQDMKYIAEIAPKHIDENIPGLLLAGHGIYAWGKTSEEAKRHVEIFEFLFEYRIKELSISKLP